MTEAQKNGWIVISMKNDWKRIFPWEQWVHPGSYMMRKATI